MNFALFFFFKAIEGMNVFYFSIMEFNEKMYKCT